MLLQYIAYLRKVLTVAENQTHSRRRIISGLANPSGATHIEGLPLQRHEQRRVHEWKSHQAQVSGSWPIRLRVSQSIIHIKLYSLYNC